MSAERARLLRQWFEAACDLPEAEWASFLQGCDEATLRAEVLDLLRRDRVPDLPLDDPLLPAAQRDALLALASDAPLPARIGSYDVVRVIGRGSMGTVYEARAPGGGPAVAVKVLRMGLPTRALLHRFRREAEILARLDHPCIARILESGTTAVGVSTLPFIAMELVSGRPLDVYCDEEQLDVRARLDLLARIGEAVEHAHRRGVVHRDLKPSNILVDGDGQPRLLDFGVARTTWPAGARASQHTATGQLVGTLQYMSPEQALGDPSLVDARSDVYALGAVAYALLAGRPPYDVSGCSFDEALRRVRQDDPPRLGTLRPDLRGPIEVVVARALEKEREDRYPTAQAFVDDLHALREGRRGLARAPGPLQLARRFARRNPRAFRVAAAFAAILLLGIAGTTWGWLEARARQREVTALLEQQREATHVAEAARADTDLARAEAERSRVATEAAWRESEAVVAFLEDMFRAVRPRESGSRIALADVLLLVAPRVDQYLADEPHLAARLHRLLATAFQAVARNDLALEHVAAAERLDQALGAAGSEGLVRTRLLRGFVLIEQGRYAEATEILQAVRPQVPEDDLELRARAGAELARALFLGGDPAASEACLSSMLDPSGHVAGVSETTDEGVRLDLAKHAGLRGDTAAAEATMRSVLQARSERLGPKHFDTLTAVHQLAELLGATGRAAEAETLHVMRVQALTELLGAEHPQTLHARSRLAFLLTDTGREAEALPELDQLVASCRRVLGPEHPNTASVLCTLSVAALHTGRPDAAALTEEALATGRVAVGNDSPSLVTALSNAGTLRMMDGKLEEGAELLREALAICQRAGGAHVLDLILVEINLTAALISLGQFDEVRPIVADALARSRAVQGDRHEQTVTLIHYQADVCCHDEDWPQARALYEEVLAAAPGLSPKYLVPVYSRAALGQVLIELGETAQAEPVLRAALAEVEQRLGPDDPLAVNCREGLARLSASSP